MSWANMQLLLATMPEYDFGDDAEEAQVQVQQGKTTGFNSLEEFMGMASGMMGKEK